MSQACRKRGGGLEPQSLAKQLTLSQPWGQIMPTRVLRGPHDFQTLRRPCMIKTIPLHVDINCDSTHVKTGNFFDVSRILNLNDGSNCRGRQRRQHGIMHRQCCQCRGSEVFILLPDFALAVDGGSRPWFQVHLAENSRRSTDPACSDRKGVNMQSLDYDGIKIS